MHSRVTAEPVPDKLPALQNRRVNVDLVAVVAIAVLLLPAYFAVKAFLVERERPAGRVKIAVLPFKNLTGDPNQEFVSDGLTEEMISQLGGLNYERLGVVSRTSVMAYKNAARPAAQIGSELGVDYILEGSVRSWSKRVRITAELIQVRDQTHIWAQSYDRETGNILALQNEVARGIAREINVKLTPSTKARLSNIRPISPAAYEAYLRGRYLWNQRTEDGMNKAIQYFDHAIELDPTYALAYVGLADSYSLLALRGIIPSQEGFPTAKAAVRKALELDPSLGDAYATLAHIRLHDWDWTNLDQDFKHAIDLNPGNAIAYRLLRIPNGGGKE